LEYIIVYFENSYFMIAFYNENDLNVDDSDDYDDDDEDCDDIEPLINLIFL